MIDSIASSFSFPILPQSPPPDELKGSGDLLIVLSPASFSFDAKDSDGTTDEKMIVEFFQITVKNCSSVTIVEYNGGARC
jgi:hypothetical protein